MQEIKLLAQKLLKLSQLRSRKPKGLINWLADVSDVLVLRDQIFENFYAENYSLLGQEILECSKSMDVDVKIILEIAREAIEKLWRNGHFVK